MKALTIFSAIGFFLIMSTSLQSQDQIIKKDKSVINCKVKEIGMDDIKYVLPDYPGDLLFSIAKDRIIKITFSNGKEMTFQVEMNNPENYLENKKNALKIDFISPVTGNTTFSYERSIKPGRSWEASLGIIGLGTETAHENVFGLFTRFGYKFLKSPDFYLRGMRYAHVLKGSYVKPEITFGYYSYAATVYDHSTFPYTSHQGTETNSFVSIMINFGKQWIYDNSFVIDMYGGVGYGFSGDEYGGYNYAMVTTGGGMPLAFGAGLKIGFLFD